MPEAYRLNDYVLQKAKGDPGKAAQGHVLLDVGHRGSPRHDSLDARVQCVRHMGRVEFTGFDMQEPTVALQNAGRFVVRYDISYS